MFSSRRAWEKVGIVLLLQLVSTACDAAEPGRQAIRFLGDVSDQFQDEIERAVGTIPDPVWQGLERRGWRVHAAPSVTEAAPWLKGTRPRGWPTGLTWDHSDAVHLPDSRLLVVGETRRTKVGERVASSRIGGVLRHELGHAFDMLLGGPRNFRSLTPAFLAVYRQDASRLTPDQRSQLRYYLQERSAGYQETFAEGFASVLGGGSDVTLVEVFREGFPNVIDYIHKSIETYQPRVP